MPLRHSRCGLALFAGCLAGHCAISLLCPSLSPRPGYKMTDFLLSVQLSLCFDLLLWCEFHAGGSPMRIPGSKALLSLANSQQELKASQLPVWASQTPSLAEFREDHSSSKHLECSFIKTQLMGPEKQGYNKRVLFEVYTFWGSWLHRDNKP